MLELLVAFDRVRTSPSHPSTGILGLVQFDYDYYLEWRDEGTLGPDEVEPYINCIKATNGEEDAGQPVARPFIIHSMQNAINLSYITGVIGDDMSMTLLVTVKDGPPKMFHSQTHLPTAIVQSVGALVEGVEVEPARNGVAYFKTIPSPQSSFLSMPRVEDGDWREQVLERFSRVTNFYADTANKILAVGKGMMAPGNHEPGNPGYVANPWIERKRPEMPKSRFTGRTMDEAVYARFKSEDGSLRNESNLFLLCHCGTVSNELRQQLWLHFLNIRYPKMTDLQFKEHCEYLKREYDKIHRDFAPPSEETISRIEKDVVRTDRFLFHPNDDDNKLVDQPCLHLMKRVLTAYVTKDAELDYVQGMNDYLSPIVYVFTKDKTIESAEYLVFWVFHEFMSIIRGNFKHCSESIEKQLEMLREMIWAVDPLYYDYFTLHHDSLQLYFCYRWLLLWFKRELQYNDTLKLWDTVLSAQNRNLYILCFALAMLMQERDALMSSCRRFDEILAHFNEKSGSWIIDKLLDAASSYELFFEKKWNKS